MKLVGFLLASFVGVPLWLIAILLCSLGRVGEHCYHAANQILSKGWH